MADTNEKAPEEKQKSPLDQPISETGYGMFCFLMCCLTWVYLVMLAILIAVLETAR